MKRKTYLDSQMTSPQVPKHMTVTKNSPFLDQPLVNDHNNQTDYV